MNPVSTMGSVISPHALSRMSSMVSNRLSGTLLAGGDRMTGPSSLDGFDLSQGNFYPPTVITNISTEDDLWREEVFGPVVVVRQFQVGSQGPLPSASVSLISSRMKKRQCILPTQANMVQQSFHRL